MKKEYIKPSILVTEIEPLSMLAASTDRIPVGGFETKPSAAPERRGQFLLPGLMALYILFS